MVGFVYMMSDKPRGVIYTGVTSDLQGRVWEHRNHAHKGFTSKYRAEKLVWFELHQNIVFAIQREKSLKLSAGVEDEADRGFQSDLDGFVRAHRRHGEHL